MRKVIHFAMFAIGILGLLLHTQPATAEGPTLTILNGLSSGYSEALAINKHGQIVGSSVVDSTGTSHAVVWNAGVPTDLGTLGGSVSKANDINNAGQIVGFSMLAGDTQSRAVLWEQGSIVDLGCLPGGAHCEAQSINKHGQIVGFSQTAEGPIHAVLWENGTIIDLDAGTGGGSRAYAINNRGKIGGFSQLPEGAGVATFWKPDQPPVFREHLTLILDLNNEGQSLAVRYRRNNDSYYLLTGDGRVDITYVDGRYFVPMAVNDLGQVAGYLPAPSDTRVVVWQDGAVVDLGPLPGPYFHGFPNDLNINGQVVGTISTAEGARAALWTMP